MTWREKHVDYEDEDEDEELGIRVRVLMQKGIEILEFVIGNRKELGILMMY